MRFIIFGRPHPNECSGGDLDGDLFSISWDVDLIPPKTAPPMDYTGRRARIMDHDVTLEVIWKHLISMPYVLNLYLFFDISHEFAGNSKFFC